ncbi:DMT family transporter [Nakamurella lactea]|uniref:DMT family transporter n=1 Tax=Nakamurella lactea TaxID=459515 RepID=UPI000429572C|nr:DMT family transporter [Nakamurella lactea]
MALPDHVRSVPTVSTPPTLPDPTAVTAPTASAAPAGWKLPVAVVVVLLLWASAFIAIRAVGDSFDPGALAFGRLFVGSIALGLLALRYRRPLPRGRSLAMVAVYGVLWFAGYTVLLNAAERHLDAGTAAMLVNVAPILVAVAAGLFLGEGFPRPLLIGIVIAFGGVAVIAFGGVGGHSDGFGVLLGLLTALLYAAGVLSQKVALRSVDAVSATWLGCLIGTVVLLPFLPQTVHQAAAAPVGAILAVVYLGIFPTAVAFTLWAYALSRSNAGALTSTTLAVPAIVVLMSWALLGEVPTVVAMIGGGLALFGVFVSRLRPRPGPTGVGDARAPEIDSSPTPTTTASPAEIRRATPAPSEPGPSAAAESGAVEVTGEQGIVGVPHRVSDG